MITVINVTTIVKKETTFVTWFSLFEHYSFRYNNRWGSQIQEIILFHLKSLKLGEGTKIHFLKNSLREYNLLFKMEGRGEKFKRTYFNSTIFDV